ncbi:MAG: hypothetical protein ABII18_03790 [bacterium]
MYLGLQPVTASSTAFATPLIGYQPTLLISDGAKHAVLPFHHKRFEGHSTNPFLPTDDIELSRIPAVRLHSPVKIDHLQETAETKPLEEDVRELRYTQEDLERDVDDIISNMAYKLADPETIMETAIEKREIIFPNNWEIVLVRKKQGSGQYTLHFAIFHDGKLDDSIEQGQWCAINGYAYQMPKNLDEILRNKKILLTHNPDSIRTINHNPYRFREELKKASRYFSLHGLSGDALVDTYRKVREHAARLNKRPNQTEAEAFEALEAYVDNNYECVWPAFLKQLAITSHSQGKHDSLSHYGHEECSLSEIHELLFELLDPQLQKQDTPMRLKAMLQNIISFDVCSTRYNLRVETTPVENIFPSKKAQRMILADYLTKHYGENPEYDRLLEAMINGDDISELADKELIEIIKTVKPIDGSYLTANISFNGAANIIIPIFICHDQQENAHNAAFGTRIVKDNENLFQFSHISVNIKTKQRSNICNIAVHLVHEIVHAIRNFNPRHSFLRSSSRAFRYAHTKAKSIHDIDTLQLKDLATKQAYRPVVETETLIEEAIAELVTYDSLHLQKLFLSEDDTALITFIFLRLYMNNAWFSEKTNDFSLFNTYFVGPLFAMYLRHKHPDIYQKIYHQGEVVVNGINWITLQTKLAKQLHQSVIETRQELIEQNFF